MTATTVMPRLDKSDMDLQGVGGIGGLTIRVYRGTCRGTRLWTMDVGIRVFQGLPGYPAMDDGCGQYVFSGSTGVPGYGRWMVDEVGHPTWVLHAAACRHAQTHMCTGTQQDCTFKGP